MFMLTINCDHRSLLLPRERANATLSPSAQEAYCLQTRAKSGRTVKHPFLPACSPVKMSHYASDSSTKALCEKVEKQVDL